MEVRNLIGGAATVCGPDLSITAAADSMLGAGIGSLGVIDDGVLIGIVTERDVLRAVAAGADPGAALVKDWMTPDPDSLSPDVDTTDAADWLLATGYRHLPVTENGKLLGVLSIKDILWALHSP